MPVSRPIGINSDVLKMKAAQVTPNSGSHSRTGILFRSIVFIAVPFRAKQSKSAGNI